MAIKKLYLFIAVALLPLALLANDKDKILEIIKKSKASYESIPAFQIDINYTLYSTATSAQVTEAYTGTLIKDKGGFYSKIHDTEFVQIADSYIKIDHNAKAMEYSKNQNTPDALYGMLDQYISYFSKFELATEGNYYKCILSTAEISMVPYSKVILYVDKNTYRISKQIMHLLVKNDYVDAKGKTQKDYPRLEIIAKNFTDKNINAEKKLSLSNYVVISNKTISPASRLSTYTFIDLTKR